MQHHVNKIAAGSPHRGVENEVHVNFYFKHSETAHELSGVLSDYLHRNAIFFDEDVYLKISDLWNKMTFSNADFLTILRKVPPDKHFTENGFEEIEKGRKILKAIAEGEISPRFRELVVALRKEIGINKK